MDRSQEVANHLRSWSQANHPRPEEWRMWQRKFDRFARMLARPMPHDLVPEFEEWERREREAG